MKEKNHVKVLSPELSIPEIKKELRSRREGGKPSYNFFEAVSRVSMQIATL